MIGVIVLNQENKIFYSNRYAEALFGYSNEEYTGKAVELLIEFLPDITIRRKEKPLLL